MARTPTTHHDHQNLATFSCRREKKARRRKTNEQKTHVPKTKRKTTDNRRKHKQTKHCISVCHSSKIKIKVLRNRHLVQPTGILLHTPLSFGHFLSMVESRGCLFSSSPCRKTRFLQNRHERYSLQKTCNVSIKGGSHSLHNLYAFSSTLPCNIP